MTYDEALRICRGQHSGPTARDLSVGPDDPHVADCLRRRGWLPDGQRGGY